MSDANLDPLFEIMVPYIEQGRKALLPVLHAAQKIYGYLPEAVVSEVARSLNIPLAEIYGFIHFFSMFYPQPVGKNIIRVCTDPACSLAGADHTLIALSQHIKSPVQGNSPDGNFRLERVPCLGLCEHAPAILYNQFPIIKATADKIEQLSNGHGDSPTGIVSGDIRILTANCGNARTYFLVDYLASGGYKSLQIALVKTPAEIINEIKRSGLVGRGGAAFPTGLKWESAAQQVQEPKYVVCNADESEPGTFKDRVLLEEDPHRVIEGMIIAGIAIGANQGYIYIRGEYPVALDVFKKAVGEARQSGYLGTNILNSNQNFDIEIYQGAGAYICGEETALFESIEGKRGFPRLKPPYPTTHGLFDQPTVINNVETLCNIPWIIENGPEEYRKIGTSKSPGSKLFCVSGDVLRPGLYEMPFGNTLRHLVNDLAGGVHPGEEMQAMLIGGAAGTFALPEQLDTRLTFEDLRSIGLQLGSGVIMVFDMSRDIRQIILQLARFFAHESCGKCFPCQMGTQRQYEIIQRVANGRQAVEDLQRLEDIGWTMTDSSICGLGQTAASAVTSALHLWPNLFKVTNNPSGYLLSDIHR